MEKINSDFKIQVDDSFSEDGVPEMSQDSKEKDLPPMQTFSRKSKNSLNALSQIIFFIF